MLKLSKKLQLEVGATGITNRPLVLCSEHTELKIPSRNGIFYQNCSDLL